MPNKIQAIASLFLIAMCSSMRVQTGLARLPPRPQIPGLHPPPQNSSPSNPWISTKSNSMLVNFMQYYGNDNFLNCFISKIYLKIYIILFFILAH